MATIQAALQGPPPQTTSAAQPTTSAAAPHAAPGVPAPTPITADQKRGFDVARTDRLDQETATQQQALTTAAQQDQAQQDAFQKSAGATVSAAGNIIKGTGVKIESLPTPGSLMLPLVVLLVFFFLLLPVNGHTRLVWIWLVITGNATISGVSNPTTIPGGGVVGGGASGDFGGPNPPSTSGTTPIPGGGNVGGGASGNFGGGASGNFNNSYSTVGNAPGSLDILAQLSSLALKPLGMTGVEGAL